MATINTKFYYDLNIYETFSNFLQIREYTSQFMTPINYIISIRKVDIERISFLIQYIVHYANRLFLFF